MKKYLFLTSALVAFTMSGVTEAACMHTNSDVFKLGLYFEFFL